MFIILLRLSLNFVEQVNPLILIPSDFAQGDSSFLYLFSCCFCTGLVLPGLCDEAFSLGQHSLD
jgi:hypothetical protein